MAIVLRRKRPATGMGHTTDAGLAGKAGLIGARRPAQQQAKRPGGPSQPRMPEWYTLRELAARLKVCTKTVRRLIRKNDIPVERVGSQIRVRSEHLPLFLDKEW
jgi:excisionase family DNA binding protein